MLFGAGKGASQFVGAFRGRGIDIAYVCDNDRARWGHRFFDLPIENPERLSSEAQPATVFIASEWADEIRSQLAERGFPDERIVSLY